MHASSLLMPILLLSSIPMLIPTLSRQGPILRLNRRGKLSVELLSEKHVGAESLRVETSFS